MLPGQVINPHAAVVADVAFDVTTRPSLDGSRSVPDSDDATSESGGHQPNKFEVLSGHGPAVWLCLDAPDNSNVNAA